MSDKDVMISIRGLHKHFGNLEVLIAAKRW